MENDNFRYIPHLFRKDNGFTAQLLAKYGLLYLTTEETNINFHKAHDVAESLTRMMVNNKPKKLVLNMSTIEHMDSSGVGALVHVFSEGKKIGCELYLLNVTQHVYRILNLVSLIDVFNIVESFEEILGVSITKK